MNRWIGAAAMGGILALALSSGSASVAATLIAGELATDLGARQHHRRHVGVRSSPPYEPHYYARPYYYRPYPYGVPYPFVFGFGPWW